MTGGTECYLHIFNLVSLPNESCEQMHAFNTTFISLWWGGSLSFISVPTKERIFPACLFFYFVCACAHMLTQGHATTHPWTSGHNLSKLVLSSHHMGHKDGTQVIMLAAKCLYPWTDLPPKCTHNEMHTLGLGLGMGAGDTGSSGLFM